MSNSNQLKNVVKQKYGKIASDQAETSSCCGSAKLDSCCSIMNDDYKNIDGYVAEADYGLGCGLPTEIANIKAGDTVIDLGSGAGNDIFIARRLTGESGRLIGVDFTPQMIEKANANLAKLGFSNVTFKLGDIENLPLEDSIADVIISNCVLNLVPDKNKAYQEIYRTLKSGGHFCISDIVLDGNMPDELAKIACLYTGCINGALQREDYLAIIKDNGFNDVTIKKEKLIDIPKDVLAENLSAKQMATLKTLPVKIYSITVTGIKK